MKIKASLYELYNLQLLYHITLPTAIQLDFDNETSDKSHHLYMYQLLKKNLPQSMEATHNLILRIPQ